MARVSELVNGALEQGVHGSQQGVHEKRWGRGGRGPPVRRKELFLFLFTLERSMPVRPLTMSGTRVMMSRTSPVNLAAPMSPSPDATIVNFLAIDSGAAISAAIYEHEETHTHRERERERERENKKNSKNEIKKTINEQSIVALNEERKPNGTDSIWRTANFAEN